MGHPGLRVEDGRVPRARGLIGELQPVDQRKVARITYMNICLSVLFEFF